MRRWRGSACRTSACAVGTDSARPSRRKRAVVGIAADRWTPGSPESRQRDLRHALFKRELQPPPIGANTESSAHTGARSPVRASPRQSTNAEVPPVRVPVFYRSEMTVRDNASYSPSAGKPAAVQSLTVGSQRRTFVSTSRSCRSTRSMQRSLRRHTALTRSPASCQGRWRTASAWCGCSTSCGFFRLTFDKGGRWYGSTSLRRRNARAPRPAAASLGQRPGASRSMS